DARDVIPKNSHSKSQFLVRVTTVRCQARGSDLPGDPTILIESGTAVGTAAVRRLLLAIQVQHPRLRSETSICASPSTCPPFHSLATSPKTSIKPGRASHPIPPGIDPQAHPMFDAK